MNRWIDAAEEGHGLRTERVPWGQWVVTVFCFALVLRLIVAAAYLNPYDTEWNIMWGVELCDGFFSAYQHVTDLDYPPLYLYVLRVVGALVKDPQIGGYPPLRMLAIKFMPCLTDSLTCLVLYRLGGRRSRLWGAAAAALWSVNPAAIFNCACWGQTDCVLLCMAALLMTALEERRVTASGVLFAAMCCTKLQGLYLAPVVGMEVLTICFGSLHYKRFHFKHIRREQVNRFLRFLAAVGGTFAVIFLPFMIGAVAGRPSGETPLSSFWKPLTVYGGGVDKYPYSTMNADNFYMLWGLNCVNDSTRILPGISAGGMGKFFLLVVIVLIVAVYVCGRERSHWLAAYLLMEGIFMLTCRQHERYQMLTVVLLLGALLQIGDKRILPLFGWQTLVVCANQCRVLSAVQEKYGWWDYYANVSGREWLQSAMEQVRRDGVAWLGWYNTLAQFNALVNVCIFFVSVTLGLQFFFDGQWRVSFCRRAEKWLYDVTENAKKRGIIQWK